MLSEAEISNLINQSGRLRMLSHRTGMFITLLTQVTETHSWFKEELTVTTQKFDDGVQQITQAVKKDVALNQRFNEFFTAQAGSQKPIKDVIHHYQLGLAQLQHQQQSKQGINNHDLTAWLMYIGQDLLVALNSLVAFFDETLQTLASNKSQKINRFAAEIESSLEEIDQINLSVKILSFNASVEAARAGEAGRGFAVVSKEMTTLSSNTRNVTDVIKKKIRAFIEALDD